MGSALEIDPMMPEVCKFPVEDKSVLTKIIHKGADMYVRFRSWLLAFVIIGSALLSLQKFLWATQDFGIGVRTDSVAYLWSAENLAKGIGIGRLDGAGDFRPYTHWPPLYPILLAGFDLMGFKSLESARLFGAICVVFLTVMTGLAIARSTNHSPWYVAGALVVLNSSPYFWESNYYAMSDPLYLTLSLSTLLLLECYFERRKNTYLVLASLLMGLAVFTRYVGLSLIIACWLMLFIRKSSPWRRKIMDGLLMGVLGLAPFGFWVVRNMLVSGTATNRALSLILIKPKEWTLAGQAILSWFDPILKATPMGFTKPILILSLAILASILFFRFFPQRENDTKNGFIMLVAVYTISYTIFTVVARLLFDPYIPLFEYRIQYPTYVGLFLLLLYGLYRFQSRMQRFGWLAPAIVVSVYVFGVWVFARGYRNVSNNMTFIGHKAGLGLVRMTDEKLLSVLKRYPLPDNRFFTDNIEKLYFLSSIYSYSITSSPSDEIGKIISQKNEHGIVIVLFDQRAYGAEYQSMIPGLHLIYQGDVDVYAAP
jgi:hypothetical protein